MAVWRRTLKTASAGVQRSEGPLRVLAWGQNWEAQCGSPGEPVLTEPREIEALRGLAVSSLSLGHAHSAAVLANGDVWTWGCGQEGKLGLGPGVEASRPCRVEALVGRARVTAVALGANHSLFLDAAGRVWSCGENREGQCGLEAAQPQGEAQATDWYHAAAPLQQQALGLAAGGPGGVGPGGDGGAGLAAQWTAQAPPLLFVNREQQLWDVFLTRRLWDQQLAEGGGAAGELFRDPGLAAAGAEAAWGLPARLGRQEHLAADLLQDDGPDEAGIAGVEVADIAASRFFSALVGADGRVWTFGGGLAGELGQAQRWVAAPSPVEPALAQCLAENGGAAAVHAGGDFVVCRTRNGRVVVWGHAASPRVLPGLRARIRHTAVGRAHAVLSDGERVWATGRWVNQDGKQCGPGWGKLKLMMQCVNGVRSVAAGANASAVVTSDGQAFMWGQLLTQADARSPSGEAAGDGTQKPQLPQGWAGLGAVAPARIEGLSGVHSLALGSGHAAAVVAAGP